MNYMWDLNLQPFIKTIVADYELHVGFEFTTFHKGSIVADYELRVGFEPTAFHYSFH